MKTVEERFWEKVDKNGLNGCWLWMGWKSFGYGRFNLHNKDVRSHRVAYEWIIGTIPEGLTIDHLCRSRDCVNPDHMEAVTHKVNILRGNSKAAHNAQRTHCIHGHPFDLFNTRFIKVNGRIKRRCRRCDKDYKIRNRNRKILRPSPYPHPGQFLP